MLLPTELIGVVGHLSLPARDFLPDVIVEPAEPSPRSGVAAVANKLIPGSSSAGLLIPAESLGYSRRLLDPKMRLPMYVPVIRGVIDRRILLNYRVDSKVLARLLPPPFRPKLVGGYGIVGACLIRLSHLR